MINLTENERQAYANTLHVLVDYANENIAVHGDSLQATQAIVTAENIIDMYELNYNITCLRDSMRQKYYKLTLLLKI